MANLVFKEDLAGVFDGVTPATMLPAGSLSGGKNVRKVSIGGGWKPRKGFALNNTTAAESGAAVKSLHMYENPLCNDRAFIAQMNSKLLKATNDPPAAGTTFGSTLGVSVGTTPGFSDMVGEYLFYADGSGAPIVYGGLTPQPKAVFSYDASEGEYIEHTRIVKDRRSDTEVFVLGAATDELIIVTEQRISAATLDLGATVNSNAVTLVVKAMRSGTWTAVSGLSDGTETGGDTTLAQDGTVSWTAGSSDTLHLVGGVMGYAYQFTWSGALSNSVDLISMTVVQAAAEMTNKWHGAWEWIAGCRFYDASVKEYKECLGQVTNESTSQYVDVSEATTSDYLYVKTLEPATAFALGIPLDYTNDANAQVDLVECLEGGTWSTCGTLTDTTLDGDSDSSFAQLGVISWDATGLSPTRRTFAGDSQPGYWYRISWDASLAADTRIYLILYASQPEQLPSYDGVVEFKGRPVLWGDPEFPNKLRFGQGNEQIMSFTGVDSGYSEPLGYKDVILCAKKFHNELLVWKKGSVWLIEGYNMATFGAMRITKEVGLSSPKTAQVIEVGSPTMHRDEPLMIAIWQDVDGVYVLDGRKPRKVSAPVQNYFNPEKTECISAANIDALDSFVDRVNNEYHLLIPDGTELVYNYVLDEWYPPWSRALTLTCGIYLRGSDDRFYTYGGTSEGFVARLEYDTSDKNASNADAAIDHYITSRAISYKQNQGTSLRFTLRHFYIEAKAQTAGDVVSTLYKNQSTSGVVVDTPSAMSLINTGYQLTTPKLDLSELDLVCFAMKLGLNTIDQELEIYSFVYEIEAQGLPTP